MNEPDPLRDAIARFAAIPQERPSPRRRPTREVVARLLAANGKPVKMHDHELLTDVDGRPLGVARTTTTATLAVSLEALGWTQAEWDDPTITK